VAADSAAFDEGFRVLSELRVSTLGMLDWGQGRAATNRGGLWDETSESLRLRNWVDSTYSVQVCELGLGLARSPPRRDFAGPRAVGASRISITKRMNHGLQTMGHGFTNEASWIFESRASMVDVWVRRIPQQLRL